MSKPVHVSTFCPFLWFARDHCGYSVWRNEPVMRNIEGSRVFEGQNGEDPFCTFWPSGDPDDEVLPLIAPLAGKLKIGSVVRVRMAIRRRTGERPAAKKARREE